MGNEHNYSPSDGEWNIINLLSNGEWDIIALLSDWEREFLS